ncbi:TetR family transcriptional regulator [Paenibacillus campinasensis]|uniref:TetR family transcriptional regulator n=1 Tax=Paenibacillus campinasensis TaxID=66347 RepID=A0ABW9SW51_9BACL|nr:TetR/AcrR family transcriptional regulator [Paenibacillus campinasensis]MUG65220.1 TetR family transcriptional regulator [Paenibacillus campinasensis]
MDRRIAKTRQSIFEAFIELMGEKSFEKITINEIAERANVNRGTVYLHFTDKYNLLDQCIETYLHLLEESCMPDGALNRVPSKKLLLSTFEFLEQNAAIYSVLISGQGVPVFRNRMMEMTKQGVEQYIKESDLNPGVNEEVMVQFLSVGITGLLEWWMVHSMPCKPEEMVDQVLLLLASLERGLTVQGSHLFINRNS